MGSRQPANLPGAEWLGSALQEAFDAVVITTKDLDPPGPVIVYANPAFERMTGYSMQEVLGATPRILQGPDTDRRVLEELRRRLSSGLRFEGRAINYRKDGSRFWLEWRITAMRDEEGRVTHWISFQHDVSAQYPAFD